MGKYRGLDTDEGWIRRAITELERKLTESMAARRLENATIGQGGVSVEGTGGVTVSGGGNVALNDGGDLVVNSGGDVVVQAGGGIDIYGTGKVSVWGATTIGSMENGRFGVATISGGSITTPSTLAQPDGFLCDAGPGRGYAVFRVDAATGKAVVSSSTGQVMLSYGTTSDGANTRILSDGSIQMVTSSKRYKQDIKDAEIDPAAVLKVTGRTWRDKKLVKEKPHTSERSVGFIAEELDEAGLGMFVDYDEQGRPDAIQYDRLSVALLAVLKDQDRRLKALEQQADTKPPTVKRPDA